MRSLEWALIQQDKQRKSGHRQREAEVKIWGKEGQLQATEGGLEQNYPCVPEKKQPANTWIPDFQSPEMSKSKSVV